MCTTSPWNPRSATSILPKPRVRTGMRASNRRSNPTQRVMVVDDHHRCGSTANPVRRQRPIGTSTAILSPSSSINRSMTANRVSLTLRPMLESGDHLVRQTREIPGTECEAPSLYSFAVSQAAASSSLGIQATLAHGLASRMASTINLPVIPGRGSLPSCRYR